MTLRPAINSANYRDFRTPDGNRVIDFRTNPYSSYKNVLLTFERRFALSDKCMLHNEWYVEKDTGFIPSSSPGITLVYDPIYKDTFATPAKPVVPGNFWLVWNPKGRTMPSFRHPSEAAAVREAERLSDLMPGQEFFVLKATSKTSTDKPKVQTAFFL